MAAPAADVAALLQRLKDLQQTCDDALHQRRPAPSAAAPTPSDGRVTLIAASKRQPIYKLMALYDAGHRDFGENYVQELQHKAAAMCASGRHPRWHLIGPLQRNKVNAVAATGATVHTIDSLALAQKLAARAGVLQGRANVLVQVRDGAALPGRAGVAHEQACALAQSVAALPELRLVGLMVLPLPGSDPREAFARLRALLAQVRRLPGADAAHELSMGMSHDFRAAILEGATMVRVGSRLFGPRP